MNIHSKGFVRFRAAAAGLCLLSHLQAAGILPVFLSLMASLEGSHSVTLACAPNHVSVVLHHASDLKKIGDSHQHGAASRVVCLLEKNGPTHGTDHTASFDSNLNCETTKSEVEAKGAEQISPMSFDPSARSISTPLLLLHPPESTVFSFASSASLRALRTTILLI